MTLFFYIAAFLLFTVLQAIFINGVYSAMEKGNVLAFIKDELTAVTAETKYKYNGWLRKSVGGACIRCMASTYGTLTFIPLFIYVFGLRWEIVPSLLFDIFILTYLNFYFYKAV